MVEPMGFASGEDNGAEAGTNEAEAEYFAFNRYRLLLIAFMVVAIVVMVVLSASIGKYHATFLDNLAVVLGLDHDSTLAVLIWRVRMPRVLAAVVIGATLAISGAVMQSVLRNPLASPYTLGISNAAAFGASFSLMASYWGIFAGTTLQDVFSGVYGM